MLDRMVATTLVVMGLGCLSACGNSVRHQPEAFVQAGHMLPVSVKIRLAEDESRAEGTLHYRTQPGQPYQAVALAARGTEYWAPIQSEGLQPGDSIEYYIDVVIDGETHGLASAARPFRVDVLSARQVVERSLRHGVEYGEADLPVRFVVFTGGVALDEASVVYEMPSIEGQVNAPLRPQERGVYATVVPARVVTPGAWRYGIRVRVGMDEFLFPKEGMGEFYVRPRPRHPHGPGPEHEPDPLGR